MDLPQGKERGTAILTAQSMLDMLYHFRNTPPIPVFDPFGKEQRPFLTREAAIEYYEHQLQLLRP